MKISEVDFGEFKAAMFDYDGTLTESGVWTVEEEVVSAIGRVLAAGFPIAVCTGRQLESFERRFGEMIELIKDEFGEDALRNLYLMAENGAVGYEYKGGTVAGASSAGASSAGASSAGASSAGASGSATGSGGWEIFYIAKWPEEVPKDDFEKKLYNLVKDKAEILTHLVPIVLAPIGRLSMDYKDVQKKSAEIFKIAKKFIKDYGAENYLHIGDSGLGCLICPADGDKDTAIKVFWEFLKKRGEERDVNFSEKSVAEGGTCREIMVVGDNPQKNGNDYYFLNGRYGTAFSVGNEHGAGAGWPIVVVDEQGKRLLNGMGTSYLLKKIWAMRR